MFFQQTKYSKDYNLYQSMIENATNHAKEGFQRLRLVDSSDWLNLPRDNFENPFRQIAKRNVKIRTIGRLKMNESFKQVILMTHR